MNFTKEQWREIYAVRARLEAFRNKIKPYPPYPSQGEVEPPPPQVVIHRYSDMGKQEFGLLQEHDRALKYLLCKQKERDDIEQNYY